MKIATWEVLKNNYEFDDIEVHNFASAKSL